MEDPTALCSTCHMGKPRPRRVTYAQVIGDRLFVIPDVSALVCDVCGEHVVDNDMLRRLSGLLWPDGREMRGSTRRP